MLEKLSIYYVIDYIKLISCEEKKKQNTVMHGYEQNVFVLCYVQWATLTW